MSTASALATRPNEALRRLDPDLVLAAIFAVVVFESAVLQRIHSIATPILILLFLIWANAVYVRARIGYQWRLSLGAVYLATSYLTSHIIAHESSDLAASNFGKLTGLFVIASATGWMLARTGRFWYYARWLTIIAVLNTPLAIIERIHGVALLQPGRTYAREGGFRAIVGVEQPLVLAALFVACIPFAWFLFDRHWRWAGIILLYAGVLSTGSNGPEFVGGVVIVLCIIGPLRSWVLRTPFPAMLFFAASVLLLIGIGQADGTYDIDGRNTTAVSNEYRVDLYRLLVVILRRRPFGYGLAGLPPNTYLVMTVPGPHDFAASIDSEVVYGATQFGYVWILVYLAFVFVAAVAAMRNHMIGLSSTSLLLIGVFVAIRPWLTLGPLFAVVMGAAGAVAAGAFQDWARLRAAGLVSRHKRSVDSLSTSTRSGISAAPGRRRARLPV